MRLNDSSKAIIFDNLNLIKYCNKSGISMEKLRKCIIEKMGDNYVFALQKENVPKSKNIIPLDIDLDTQPDIVLIMKVDKGIYKFDTTGNTTKILNI